MKPLLRFRLALLWLFCSVPPAFGQHIQFLTPPDPALLPSGGDGDSCAPVVSEDGRFVLFASTSDNLILCTNGAPIPWRFPYWYNVYLRDRVNGSTVLVSANTSGVNGGNGNSIPVGISTDGRFAVFESSASDLVANDTNDADDVFVRDLAAGSTQLVSVNTNGLPGNGTSSAAAMTPDGRYVTFTSAASDLVANDTNAIPDVFVRDLQTGTTVLASVGNGPAAPGAIVQAPDISPDGRFVAFFSNATNLVSGVPSGGDIYVRDLVANTTVWASSYARTAVPPGTKGVSCFNHALSSDGRFVAYEAARNDLWAGTIVRYNLETGQSDVVETNGAVLRLSYQEDRNLQISPEGRFIVFVGNTNCTNGVTTCIRLWDAQTGTSMLVSGDSNGQVLDLTVADRPAADWSGQRIVFLCNGTGLVSNTVTAGFHLYVRDLISNATTLLDADASGAASNLSAATVPSMSSGGGVVEFESEDGPLAVHDNNRRSDVFEREFGTQQVTLISAHDPALGASTPNGWSHISPNCLSADGRYLVFASDADNLVAGDTNGFSDIYVRDLASGAVWLVTVATNGACANGDSAEARNLVFGNYKPQQHIFVCDLVNGAVTLVSSNIFPADGASFSPMITRDGRYVLFESLASNLGRPGYNLWVRDLQSRTNYPINGTLSSVTPSALPSAMSRDGRFIVYEISFSPGSSVQVWDTQLASLAYTNSRGLRPVIFGFNISGDGSRLAYADNTGLYVADLATKTDRLVESNPTGAYRDLVLNQAGDELACAMRGVNVGADARFRMYLYQVNSGGKVLLDHAYGSDADPGNGESVLPTMSPDGRLIVYQSTVTNLVAGGTSGRPDLYYYDLHTGENTLLSAGEAPTSGPGNSSHRAVFSDDGSTLVFESEAADLTPGGQGCQCDLFGYEFLRVQIAAHGVAGQGPLLSWPSMANRNYDVQYRDQAGDAAWQNLPGNPTNQAGRAWIRDSAPSASHRFYRVRSF